MSIDVRVNAPLTDLESVQLDMWIASHVGRVQTVEIHASAVYVTAWRERGEFADRTPGELTQALDDAYQRVIAMP